jgi:hypothetical protein
VKPPRSGTWASHPSSRVTRRETRLAGTITGESSWAPTKILPSSAPAYKGAVTYQVRLTVVGSNGAFTVDDTYFDPYKSG